MINRFISTVTFALLLYFAYKYRYRLLNVFLGRRLLRKLAISLAMQIPVIRDKALSSVLQSSNRPQNV
ncbi:sodium:proton antiporter [Bacillus sp. FJAT-45037]|uniref:sodium:proton antiporter n=1 Tax=Bacillus sp. FJAT-45037 TaxID=2011007 RepID=UPI000C2445AF|nr:sodium:proton antiporter [Bacillus sp. FJAT-45037]